MEASHKTHRPHIKVGKDEEEEEEYMLCRNSFDSPLTIMHETRLETNARKYTWFS